MAPLPDLLSLPFFSPSTPPINSLRKGSVFGSGANATLSYYYPLSPSDPARTAFSTGTWPHDRTAVPKTIYEYDPPSSQGFDARVYTCFNDEIGLGLSENVIVVPGADAKETINIKAGEGGITSSKVKVNGDKGAPERIRDYQLKKAEESPKCDGRTGVAVDALHWGAWQHSCFDGNSEWAERGRKTRGDLLRERAERGFEINSRIRKMWEEKNEEVKVIDGWTGRGKEKAILEREERFWKESFEIREEGREVDEGVEREFERRMKKEVWGEVVEEYRSWEKGGDDEEECQDDECECREPYCRGPEEPECRGPECREPKCRGPECRDPKCQGPECQEPKCREPECQKPKCREPECREPECRGPGCPEPKCRETECQEPKCREPDCREPECREPGCPETAKTPKKSKDDKPKDPAKPKEPQHPKFELGKSHYDRPKAMPMKAKPAEIKVKEKNGKVKVKVKDGHAEIRVKGKDGKLRVKVKDKAGNPDDVGGGHN